MNDDAVKTVEMFNVPAAGYDRLIGRYLTTLGPALADAAGIRAGMRVLDVGCGPGGLTSELVARVGAGSVAAIDPSSPFAEACRVRNPGVDVREGFAESLPFEDNIFDTALSSLVVGFMSDAAAGIREMARVVMPGGVVAACMWDRDGMTALEMFGRAMADLDPSLSGGIKLAGDTEGEIADLLRAAGLTDVEDGALVASGSYAGFDDWWMPFTLGIGPHGIYCQSLDDDHREALRLACRDLFDRPDEPFTLEAHAWFARGTVTTPAA